MKPDPRKLRLAALPKKAPTTFELVPDAETLAALRGRLELSGLRKLRFVGEIAPMGRENWHLSGHLGATAVQPCGITNAPVSTRIEEAVERRYLADWSPPAEAEAEMPEDDTAEALPETLDLLAVAEEALSLALPAFPRAPGAELGTLSARPAGAAPLDADAKEKPFAALAELRRKLEP